MTDMSNASSTLTLRVASAFEAARDGDAQATALLLNQYRGLIRRTLSERLGADLGKTRDLEDLEQDVAIRLMRSLDKHQWRGRKAFQQWLRLLARGEIVDQIREVQALKRGGDTPHTPLFEDAVGSARAGLETQADQAKRLAWLQAKLDALPFNYAQAIILSTLGHTYSEIGVLLGVSAEAARKLVSRGKAKLLEGDIPET